VDRLRLRLIRPNTRSRKHTPDMIPDQFCDIAAESARLNLLAAQFGLLRRLFFGIFSTFWDSARSISRRAIRSIKVAVVRPSRSASCAAVSTFWAKPSRLPGYAIPVPLLGCEMKSPTYVAELQKKLGAPSSETIESLRLLKAFLKLPSDQRSEIIELVERLAADPSSGDASLS
jgi:hypothetical protein